MGGAEELKGGYGQCDCLEGTQNFCHAEVTRSFPVTLCFFLPLSRLVPAHPALVNAIVLVLHSVAGSTPLPGADSSSRSAPSSSYRDMPGRPQGSVTSAPWGARDGPGICFTQQLCIALAEGVPWELSV